MINKPPFLQDFVGSHNDSEMLDIHDRGKKETTERKCLLSVMKMLCFMSPCKNTSTITILLFLPWVRKRYSYPTYLFKVCSLGGNLDILDISILWHIKRSSYKR